MYDDEYLEFFEDQQTHNSIRKKLEHIVDGEKCLHENLIQYPDGNGYCRDCGVDISNIENQGKCPHSDTYEDDNGLTVCRDCHEELEIMNDKPEWRNYSSEGGASRNPSRCQQQAKQAYNSVEKAFTDHRIDIPKVLISHVEQKYKKIMENRDSGNIARGKGKLALIAACLFYVYREFGEYRTSDYVGQLFGLPRRKMSAGLTVYQQVFRETRTQSTAPEDLIKWILNLTGVSQKHYRRIVQISKYLNKSSILLARSSPQSIASATVYFYLCLNPEYKNELGLTKSEFAERALLSDITLSKIMKDIVGVSKEPVKI